MNLQPHRPWITPLVMGAFLLSSVTGVLMFFHLNIGMNKLAHEWLSWAMLAGVVAHVLLNQQAFLRYLKTRTGQVIVLLFALILALSFLQIGKKPEPPYMPVIRMLAKTPLTELAKLSGRSDQQVMESLQKQGIAAQSSADTLESLVGPDTRKHVRIINQLLTP